MPLKQLLARERPRKILTDAQYSSSGSSDPSAFRRVGAARRSPAATQAGRSTKLLVGFLEFLEQHRGVSQLTVKNYGAYLRRPVAFLGNPTRLTLMDANKEISRRTFDQLEWGMKPIDWD